MLLPLAALPQSHSHLLLWAACFHCVLVCTGLVLEPPGVCQQGAACSPRWTQCNAVRRQQAGGVWRYDAGESASLCNAAGAQHFPTCKRALPCLADFPTCSGVVAHKVVSMTHIYCAGTRIRSKSLSLLLYSPHSHPSVGCCHSRPASAETFHACPCQTRCCLCACVCVPGGSIATCFNDLWVLDLEQRTWSKPEVQGTSPKPRAGHSGALVGDYWYILGGGNNVKGEPSAALMHDASEWQKKIVRKKRAVSACWCLGTVMGRAHAADFVRLQSWGSAHPVLCSVPSRQC